MKSQKQFGSRVWEYADGVYEHTAKTMGIKNKNTNVNKYLEADKSVWFRN